MLRKTLFILLSLCVGFAALANGAAGILQSLQPPAAMTECHLSGQAQAVVSHATAAHAAPEQAQTGENFSVFPHGCCAQIAGLLSAPIAPLFSLQSEAIAFRPVLRLLSRATNIDRPPKKNA